MPLITYLTYLRFDPKPGVSNKKSKTYFMHIEPPYREGKPRYYTTQKRAENFAAKIARNWNKGGNYSSVVSGIVVKVNALIPPLSTTSLADLEANHEVIEVKPGKS